jgi:hypothetical protein
MCSLVSCVLQTTSAWAAPASAPSTRDYVNDGGAYGIAYPATWAAHREDRPTDVFVLAQDRHAGLRILVLPETVAPSPALVQWLVQAIVQPVGRLTSAPVVREVTVQGEDGLATAAPFRLHNGVTGLLMAMLVAHDGALYLLAGAVLNQRAQAVRRDTLQLADIAMSLTFAKGGADPGALDAGGNGGGYAPASDWTYVGVGGDAGSDGQCSYYDDPDTGSSVMVGNC